MENAQRLYRNGEWTRFPDPFPQDVQDWDEAVKQAGYQHFFSTGDANYNTLAIKVYRGSANYLVEVDSLDGGSEFVYVEALPDLMDLLSRWVPVANGVTLSNLLTSFEGGLAVEDIIKAAARRK